MGVCYIPGDMNTSDGLTKDMSSANIRGPLTRNTVRIATEEKGEIRKRTPPSRRHTVYPEEIQGGRI